MAGALFWRPGAHLERPGRHRKLRCPARFPRRFAVQPPDTCAWECPEFAGRRRAVGKIPFPPLLPRVAVRHDDILPAVVRRRGQRVCISENWFAEERQEAGCGWVWVWL